MKRHLRSVARRPNSVMGRLPIGLPTNVMARLDRAITLNIVLMQMERRAEAMTKEASRAMTTKGNSVPYPSVIA